MEAKVWRKGGFVPEQANPTDIGYDLKTPHEVCVFVEKYTFIPLDIVVKPPDGYYFDMVPRSSTFKKHGIILANSVGVIDPSYSGENDCIGAIVYMPKCHKESHTIPKGTKLFQLILRKARKVEWVDMTDKPYEDNSRGGWGSSGD